MMKFHELKIKRRKTARRVGRGISAGRGKTAGRGTKGQGARKSGGVRPGFEGGQMPIYMRLPHLGGFKSHRPKAEVVYTGQLSLVKKTTIDSTSLHEAGLVSSPFNNVKLILGGEVAGKKEVKLQAASQAAQKALKKAGGSFTAVDRLARSKQSPKSDKK
ncbi:TPA: 50S ribosomal protein L15 [Candidatus Saccharibacteria bacterium]|nr:50S ribosomal protein L15 [Candidatus Saccharibacteria bacterium]